MLVENMERRKMRSYTEEAIKDRFKRILSPSRIDEDKQLLKRAGVEVNDVTFKAFLVGRLNTLIFDVVASLEGRSGRKKGKRL